MNSMEIFAQAVDKACRCACGSTKPAGHEKDADLARRDFLRNAIASSAVVLAGTTIIRARPASAQSTLTPEAALKALMDGNQRYVAGQLQSLNEDLSILKAKTAEKQEPVAAVLSCVDSRVPVELSSTRASAKSSSSV
jgi:carbonic anhydrase